MHRATRPFEIVFLTNFSDACFRAIPALAQLADEIDMRLTLLHASGSDTAQQASRESDIRSFFAEADQYPACRRLVVPGSPIDAIRRVQAESPVDLVVAPAGDPLGLPRIGHNSLRSRLIHECGTPVWTCGHAVPARQLSRPTRTIVCTIDDDRPGVSHVRLASEYANRLGATLQLVQVVPDIDEGSLLLAYAERTDEKALRAVKGAGATDRLAGPPLLTDRRGLANLLRTCAADLVFTDGQPWLTRQWLARRVSATLDALPCPVICADSRRKDVTWHLNPSPTRTQRSDFMLAREGAQVSQMGRVGVH